MKSTKKITAAARRHEFFVMRRRERFELHCEQCAANAEFVRARRRGSVFRFFNAQTRADD